MIGYLRAFRWGALVLVLANLCLPARAADLVLDSSSGYTLPVEINGHRLRLRVDLSASGYILLNPGTASRIGLNGSMVRSEAWVGPHRLRGGSNATRINVAGAELRERVAWFDRDAVEGADGVVSPEVLPYDTITFRLGPPNPNDVETQLTLFYSKSGGLALPHPVVGVRMGVDFSIFRADSIATASAGALIAAEHGSSWSGETRAEVISFGIERPVRRMNLARPLLLGRLDLAGFLVRTSDNRGSHTLPPDTPEDPSEIVVNAQRESRQPPMRMLTVALDRLSRCSSLTYRKPGRQLVLRCAP
jgi:hypothetical protein